MIEQTSPKIKEQVLPVLILYIIGKTELKICLSLKKRQGLIKKMGNKHDIFL